MIDAGVLVPWSLLLPGPPCYVAAVGQSVANFSILVQIVMSKQSLLRREQKIAARHEQLRVPRVVTQSLNSDARAGHSGNELQYRQRCLVEQRNRDAVVWERRVGERIQQFFLPVEIREIASQLTGRGRKGARGGSLRSVGVHLESSKDKRLVLDDRSAGSASILVLLYRRLL